MTAFEIPPIEFFQDRWLSWEQLSDVFRRPELKRRGAYVVAFFDDEEPPPRVELPHRGVVYVGEAHGRRASLEQRLMQFGFSAGFYPNAGQQPGHYAAWAVPTLRPGGVTRRNQPVDPRGFFFAVIPQPDSVSTAGDAPGVFPVMIESVILWQHVCAFERLPALNNSGRQITEADERAREAMRQAVSNADIEILTQPGHSFRAVEGAASNALEEIARAWGYGPARKFYVQHEGLQESVSRHLARGAWLEVGRSPNGAWVSIWRDQEHCEFGPFHLEATDEGPSTTVEGFRELLGKLWDRWR